MPLPESAASTLVVFDLDGTLVETGPDLVASLNEAISTLDLAPFPIAAVGHLVGKGARVTIEHALEMRGVPLETGTVDRLLARFLAYYDETMPGQSAPYPGLADALGRLEDAGMRLAVCTNKSEALARKLLDRLGMARRFAVITGGDTFDVRKPDGGHILKTVARAGGDPAASMMIGDSINDIAAANDAGIASIAVTFGYSDMPAGELGATAVIDSFDALTTALVGDLIDINVRRKHAT